MNYFSFSHLVLGLICTICGLLVFVHNTKSFKNRMFAVYCASVAVWGYFYAFWQLSEDPDKALILVRGLMMGAIWIPVLHYHFILALFEINNRLQKKILIGSYILTATIFLSNFSPLFIQGVEQRMFFPYWPVPGFVFHIYTALFSFLVCVAIYQLHQFSKIAPLEVKKEVRWIQYGTIIAYGAGCMNLFLWYKIPIPPYLNFLLSIFYFITTWLLLKIQLLDIHSVLKKISLMLMIYLFLLVLILPVMLPFATQWLLKSPDNPLAILLIFGGGLGIMLSLGPFVYASIIRNSYWLRDQLSTGLTHELKSPLSTIHSMIEILTNHLRQPNRNDRKTMEYMQIIEKNTLRLEGFVSELLDLSKIQHGEIEIRKQYLNPIVLIQNTIDEYAAMAKIKDLQITFKGKDTGKLYVDPEKFRQVISNLLSNAIKFSEKGEIVISTAQAHNFFECSIKDNGKGIPKEDLDRIFERFYQTRGTNRGAGLGLAIAKGWVEAHNGKIRAKSEGKGRGCEIIFNVPI